VNRLLRSERVIVSDVPGTTRDSIDVPFTIGKGVTARHYVLVDTAGLRRSGKVSTAVEKFSHMRTEGSIKGADVVVLVLDALRGTSAHDKRIAASVLKYGKGCVVLINKWDAIEETTQRKYGPEVMRIMPFLGYCPIVFASAKTGYNIRRTIQAIDCVASQVQLALPTGILNRTVTSAYERVQPPSVKGKRLKLFYATQVGIKPVRIRIFVNDPSRVVASYREYLIKMLRRKFGLEGAPVFLEFKSRRVEQKRR
jgi:GTP-binding protein